MQSKAENYRDKNNYSDTTLMLTYRAGDVRAFEILYRRYKNHVFNYFHRITGEKTLARELFQDVWMSVIQGRNSYHESQPFKDWLLQITHNRIIDHQRYSTRPDQMRSSAGNVSDIAHPLKPAEVIAFSQNRSQVNKAITLLPFEQKDALLLRLEWDLSLEKLATISGESIATLQRRLRYASNKLRLLLRSA